MRGQLNKVRAVGNIKQAEHLDGASARKSTGDVLCAGRLLTADISAAGRYVGTGSLLRIRVTATTYLAFSDDSAIGAVSSSTDPGLELFTAGVYLVTATGDWLRGSAAVARLEILEDHRS